MIDMSPKPGSRQPDIRRPPAGLFGFTRLLFSLAAISFMQLAISVYAATPGTQEPTPEEESQGIPQQEENSSEPSPALAKPVKIRLKETQRQLLTQIKGPPEPIWLPVEDQQVLAFWQPDQSGQPLGAVLMLHAQGQNPRWKATLLRLHEYLPAYGWATLSVELPDLPPQAIPERPQPDSSGAHSETSPPEGDTAQEQPTRNTEAADTETATEESAVQPPAAIAKPTREDVEEQIQLRIQAASAYLHQQGQFNLVVLGEGISAQWALQYLAIAVPPAAPTSADTKRSAVIERAVRALVLLNPKDEPGNLTDLLQHPAVPTFDVFTDFSLDIRKAADKRKQKARKAGYEHYVQRRLPPMTGATDADEIMVTKAIRGFLQKHAKGEEFQ